MIGKNKDDGDDDMFMFGKGKQKPESTKWAEDGEDGGGGGKPEETATPEAAPEEAKKDPLEVAAEVLASGKKGGALAAAVKKCGDTLPGWALLYKILTPDNECPWKAPEEYGAALKVVLGEHIAQKEQVEALFYVQKYLHETNFEPKGLIEKIFINLYNLELVEAGRRRSSK